MTEAGKIAGGGIPATVGNAEGRQRAGPEAAAMESQLFGHNAGGIGGTIAGGTGSVGKINFLLLNLNNFSNF